MSKSYQPLTLRTFPCGCVVNNLALSPCKAHSERNPPPGWHPTAAPRETRQDRDLRHQAETQAVRRAEDQTDRQGDPGETTTPSSVPTGRRSRWNPETGSLEPK